MGRPHRKVDIALKRLQNVDLKVNAEKSFFGHSELEYLGYWVTRNGIMPLPKKVDFFTISLIVKT